MHKDIFAEQKICVPKYYSNTGDISCVCNSTYCDEFPELGKIEVGYAAVYVSSKSGKRFQKSMIPFYKTDNKSLFKFKKKN